VSAEQQLAGIETLSDEQLRERLLVAEWKRSVVLDMDREALVRTVIREEEHQAKLRELDEKFREFELNWERRQAALYAKCAARSVVVDAEVMPAADCLSSNAEPAAACGVICDGKLDVNCDVISNVTCDVKPEVECNVVPVCKFVRLTEQSGQCVMEDVLSCEMPVEVLCEPEVVDQCHCVVPCDGEMSAGACDVIEDGALQASGEPGLAVDVCELSDNTDNVRVSVINDCESQDCNVRCNESIRCVKNELNDVYPEVNGGVMCDVECESDCDETGCVEFEVAGDGTCGVKIFNVIVIGHVCMRSVADRRVVACNSYSYTCFDCLKCVKRGLIVMWAVAFMRLSLNGF